MTAVAASYDPAWRGRVGVLLLAAVLLWPALVWTEFKPWEVFDAQSLKSTGRFLRDFVPPRHDPEFLHLMLLQTWRTVAIATDGLVLAFLVAVPLALVSSAQMSISSLSGRMARGPYALRQTARWAAIVLRSIPELVWALLLVRVVGLGPTAGVIAIGITYGGMLGKVYAEILESGEAAGTQALLRNGAGRLQAFFYGTLPQCSTELVGYTVYRWECAIRSSVVLGFVGAGGLGQELDNATKMFAGAEVSAILIIFIALVAIADRMSAWLRKELG
ncbi:MAG: ABC transporter permease subunit [Burkholderiaceae bacterium]|nr:ABC transporter permease subunit [Burkholderiaceae bacterium]MDH3461484.1 ABC transporter permease subunit [Burkholderiaceae bacterium]